MPRPPAARDKVVAAFAALVAADGEQGATIEAVASRAGVSKGGLLYHFPSREALVQGLVERLLVSAALDVEAMRAAAEGPVEYYLATSAVSSGDLDDLNTCYVAASRITQTGAETARAAIEQVDAAWLQVLEETVGDPVRAQALALIGDGLYLHAIRGEADLAIARWEAIRPMVRAWVASSSAAPGTA